MKRLLFLPGVITAGLVMAHGPEGGPSLEWRPPVGSFDATDADPDGNVQLDLEVDGRTLKLFVRDHYGEPLTLDIAEARAFVSSDGQTTSFMLRPAGMNMLSGQGDFEPKPGMRVDISLRLPGRRPISRDFHPLRNR